MDYSDSADDSLASLNWQGGAFANYDPGGENTGVLDRWSVKKIEVKKFIDDVSGCKKIHCNENFRPRLLKI